MGIRLQTAASMCIPLITALLCLSRAGVVLANMDLYLPKSEVKALFGAENMQLYYVRDGVFNHNAINFKAHVQANKENLDLVWKSTNPGNDVLYELKFPYEMPEGEPSDLRGNDLSIATEMINSIVKMPIQVNINTSGKLPSNEEKFRVTFPCNGQKTGEVTIVIEFKFRFTDVVKDEKVVELRCLRKCVKDEKRDPVLIDENNSVNRPGDKNGYPVPGPMPGGSSGPEPDSPQTPETTPSHASSKSTDAFYISISVVTGIIIMSVVVIRVWHARATKRHERSTSESYTMSNLHQNQFLRPDLPNNATAQDIPMDSNASWMYVTPIINDLGTDVIEIRRKLSPMAVPRSDVVLDEILQEGTFSRIYRGVLEGRTPVLVKTVTSAASEEQTRLLLFESSLLRGMHHRNLLPIENVVLDGPDPPLVLFPYTKGGNLKRYLKDIKYADKSGYGTLSSRQRNFEQASTQDLVDMSEQVARGMNYLAKLGLVHKDLATRNCVIDTDMKVKITDNALARDMFPADYCCLGDNENRPVRWLAMESLIHKVYSTASDVWSFGVLLWELQSMAQTPYNDIDDFEMAVYLRDGFRLSQPINCPDHLYRIMALCWHYSPDKRPTFSQLLKMLTEFNAELGEYV